MDIRNRLGSIIKRLRVEMGWSQEEFADRSGIHRTYVGDIERAARNPTITIIERLAKALNVRAFRVDRMNSRQLLRSVIIC